MAGSYPTRWKPSYWYFPTVATVSYVLMLIGVGLWVHYTMTMYYASQQVLAILNYPQNWGVDHFSEAYSLMIATCVLFLIFGTCITALAAWRGWLEVEQDLQGRLSDHADTMFLAVLGAQVMWWLVMVLVVYQLYQDGLLAGWFYMVKLDFETTLAGIAMASAIPAIRATIPANPNIYNCPTTCFNGASAAYLSFQSGSGLNNSTFLCVCDPATIQSAYNAVNTGYGAIAGTLVGIWIMFIYGNALCYYMSALFAHVRREIDFNERLTGANAK